MVREVIARLGAVLLGLALICLLIVYATTADKEQDYAYLTLQAKLLEWVGPPLPQQLDVPYPSGGKRVVVPVAQVPDLPFVAYYADRYKAHATLGLMLFLFGSGLILAVAHRWYVHAGHEKMKTRHIRGQKAVDAPELAAEVAAFNLAEVQRRNLPGHIPASLAGMPYPLGSEREHTLLVGSPGSGKGVALHKLIRSIRRRGDRGLIYDPEVEYAPKHYDPSTDIILNPFDDRSPAWNPFLDARGINDWNRLAGAFFKDPKGGDPYWTSTTRQLFAWTCYALQAKAKEEGRDVSLLRALDLLLGTPKRLQQLLVGTPAESHLGGATDNNRITSLVSVMAEGVSPLVHLISERPAFSITDWLNPAERNPGLLFLAAPESHIATLRPILSFWAEIAVSALLSREEQTRFDTWLVLDEFPTLGRLDKLADGPQRLRKYGGCMVLAMQQVSQIQDLYGRDKAHTIIGQCATKLILRAQDPETARHMSEQLGRAVIHRVNETTSYGAHTTRDGVSLGPREEIEPVFLPEDIMNFPALSGAIRVSNIRKGEAFPVARIAFEVENLPDVAPAFVPRTGPDPVATFLNRHKPKPEAPTTAPPDGGGSDLEEDGEGAVGAGETPEAEKVAEPGDLPTERDRKRNMDLWDEEDRLINRRQSDLFDAQDVERGHPAAEAQPADLKALLARSAGKGRER